MTRVTRAVLLAVSIVWPTAYWAQSDRTSGDDEATTFSPPQDSKRFMEALERAEKHMAVLEDALTTARRQTGQIARYLQTKNADPAALQNPETHRQVYDKYPATELFSAYRGNYRSEGFEVDPERLNERIDRYLRELTVAQQCVRLLRAGETVTSVCAPLLSCPGSIGVDDKGFYRFLVEENYKLTRKSVTSRETAFDRSEADGRSEAAIKLQGHEQDLVIDSCIMASLLNSSIVPTYVTVNWSHEKALRGNFATFRATCSIPPDRQYLRNRVIELASQFPKDWELKELASRADQACFEAAKYRCANVFQIRQSWAIAYVTRACEVRRVTKADLEADVKKWTQASEVEKQEHLIMADVIDACREADAAGFTWTFREPELSSDCVKGTGASKGKPGTGKKSKPSLAPKPAKTPDSL